MPFGSVRKKRLGCGTARRRLGVGVAEKEQPWWRRLDGVPPSLEVLAVGGNSTGWRRWFRGPIWTYVFVGLAQAIALVNHPRLPLLNIALLSVAVACGTATHVARRSKTR